MEKKVKGKQYHLPVKYRLYNSNEEQDSKMLHWLSLAPSKVKGEGDGKFGDENQNFINMWLGINQIVGNFIHP